MFTLSGSTHHTLDEANANYQLGLKAKTYEEKKTGFNKALLFYSKLEEKIKSSSSQLNNAIGDTYFQLGEYPWAILYYHRSLEQKPEEPLLAAQMEKTKKILGLPLDIPPKMKTSIGSLFSFFHQFHLLYWTLFITFICLSCAIWWPSSFVRKMAAVCTLFALLFLGIHAFEYYSQPLEGILIQTSGFYRAPDKNQIQATNQLLMAGTKVQILQMTKEGSWLKIMQADEKMGYVPTEKVRSISAE